MSAMHFTLTCVKTGDDPLALGDGYGMDVRIPTNHFLLPSKISNKYEVSK